MSRRTGPTQLPPEFRPYRAPAGFGAITCYFNPGRYRTKLLNYELFRESLLVSGIPCLTVECVFEGQRSELAGWPGVHAVTSRHPMWLKERLLNIAIGRMPADWQYVAWLDCDLLFDDADWAVRTAERLKTEMVAQLFSRVARLPEGETWGRNGTGGRESAGWEIAGWESFAAVLGRRPNDLLRGQFASHGHTGFGWAARRELLTRYGLYDGCVGASGDHMMAHAFAGDWTGPCIERTLTSRRHREHFAAWAGAVYRSVRARVSYAPGTVYHLWHGETEHRRYGLRELEFAAFEFDPETDLRMGNTGCWEWASDKPALHAWAAEYFRLRQEDGVASPAAA